MILNVFWKGAEPFCLTDRIVIYSILNPRHPRLPEFGFYSSINCKMAASGKLKLKLSSTASNIWRTSQMLLLLLQSSGSLLMLPSCMRLGHVVMPQM